jgi:N-acylneuraminate cytidylyltransferase
MSSSKIHALILARGGSKGIKNKNLILINKKALIYWSIKACLNTKKIKNVWVSSDSNRILETAKKFGALTIKRPKNLSSDQSSSESGWIHAIKEIKKKEKVNHVVALQATSPIRGKDDLKEAIELFISKKSDSLFSSTTLDSHFTWQKIKGELKADYNTLIKRKIRQNIKEKFIENGSFYIFSVEKFLKYKKRLFGKIINYNQDKIKSFEIDNKKDLIIVKSILQNVPKNLKIIN